jgi:hypothetical protein
LQFLRQAIQRQRQRLVDATVCTEGKYGGGEFRLLPGWRVYARSSFCGICQPAS